MLRRSVVPLQPIFSKPGRSGPLHHFARGARQADRGRAELARMRANTERKADGVAAMRAIRQQHQLRHQNLALHERRLREAPMVALAQLDDDAPPLAAASVLKNQAILRHDAGIFRAAQRRREAGGRSFVNDQLIARQSRRVR